MKIFRKIITVSWFSAGVSSAVATWLARDQIDKIFYIHVEDQHQDSIRFVRDCERWYNKKIELMISPYKSVENALRAKAYGTINAAGGAACTRYLKQRVRREWECANMDRELCSFRYVWGMDFSEKNRCEN